VIWAPRYRQAAYGAFLLNSEDARKALDFAFADVAAAFERFLRAIPPESPIIVAGHSQGGLHASRLLERHRQQLKGRLVAAYAVGWPLSVTADLPAMGLPPCTRQDQAGCVLSWQTFSAPANPSLIIDAWEGTDGPTGIKRKRSDMLCVNPITGTRDGQARDARGAQMLEPTANLSDARLVPGIGASCENGLLVLGNAPQLRGFVLPGNNYHVYDYALFWGAIRHDAERRIRAWHRS
jgi:pimeloyl-ACP methyl ester carboxylesterase